MPSTLNTPDPGSAVQVPVMVAAELQDLRALCNASTEC